MLAKPVRLLFALLVGVLLVACTETPTATPPTAPSTPPTDPTEPTASLPDLPDLPDLPTTPPNASLPLPPLRSITAESLLAAVPVRTIGLGQLYGFTFGPDETLIAATSMGLVWLRQADLTELGTIALNPVFYVTASADGTFVAYTTAPPDEEVRTALLRVEDGAFIAEMPGLVPTFTADGTVLATGSDAYAGDAQTSSLWNTSDGSLRTTVDGGAPHFSPDGRLLATVESRYDTPSLTRIYSVDDGTLLLTLEATDPAFSPDTSLLAVSREAQVEVYDLPTGELWRTVPTNAPGSAAFSADGQRLLIMDGQTLVVWDLENDREVTQLADVNRSFDALGPFGPHFSSDGSLVATLEPAVGDCPPGGALVVSTDDGTVRYTDDESFNVVFAPNNDAIALNLGDGLRIVPFGQESTNERSMTSYNDVVFSPDGTSIALATWGRDPQGMVVGIVELWDVADGTRRSVLRTDPNDFAYQLERLSFSPDGQRMTALVSYGCAAFGSWKLVTWDVASGEILHTIDELPLIEDANGMGPQLPSTLSIAPDGSSIAWSEDFANGIVLRFSDGSPDGFIPTEAQVTALAFTPDSSQLLVADATGQVRYLNPDGSTGSQGDSGTVFTGLSMSADGSRVLALRDQGDAVILDGQSLMPLADIALEGPVRTVRLSPDGSLISIADMTTVTVYDGSSGDVLGTLPSMDSGLALSPDQRLIATITNGQVTFWGAVE